MNYVHVTGMGENSRSGHHDGNRSFHIPQFAVTSQPIRIDLKFANTTTANVCHKNN